MLYRRSNKNSTNLLNKEPQLKSKMMKKTNSFKLAMVAVGMLTIGTVSAQQTDATNADLAKQATAVKSVDNKGTIKHVQVANGLTQVTDAATNVTTIQLGGTLVAPTTITASAGKALNIEGIAGVDKLLIEDLTDVINKPAASYGTDGLTLMVRDEKTGEIKKLLAEDAAKFINVAAKNAYTKFDVAAKQDTGNLAITVSDLPKALYFKPSKLFVYRNGVKLLQEELVYNPAGGEVSIDTTKVTVYKDDVIEVQYIN